MKTLYLSDEEFNILYALKRKSEETYLHSLNVSRLSMALGISYGLPQDALRSDRCYRKGYDREKTFAILCSDGGINRSIVERLYEITGPVLQNAAGYR